MSAYDTFGSTALPDADPDGVQAERDAEADEASTQPYICIDCAAGWHHRLSCRWCECGCPCHGGA